MGWASPGVAIAYVRSPGRPLEEAIRAWNGHVRRSRGLPGPMATAREAVA